MQARDRQQSERRWRQTLAAARRRLFLHGLVAWLAVTGAVGLLLLTALAWAGLPRWVALGAVASGALLVLVAAAALLLPPWRRLRSRERLARTLDRAGGYHDTLAASEEVLRRPERWRADTTVRAALLSRLLARGDRLLADLDLARLLPVSRPWLTFATLAAVLAASFWLGREAPDRLSRGWQTVQTAWSPPPAPRGGLLLAPDRGYVVAGETFTVAAHDLVAAEAEPPVCEVRSGTGVWRPLPARAVVPDGVDPVLPPPYERWEARLREVRADLEYRFRRGHRVSDARRLLVWRPPLLVRLAARVEPPAYTGQPAQDLARLPAYLEVLAGSRVVLDGVSSSTLAAAAMVTDDGDTTSLDVVGDRVGGAFVAAEPLSFTLHLRDERGLAGASELTHEMAVIPDREPLARLQRPDDDGRLPLSAPLSLRAGAEDDHGLAAVDLLVRRGDPDGGAWVADLPGGRPTSDDEGWERLPLLAADGTPRRGRQEVELSLGSLAVTATPREVGERAAVSLALAVAAGDLSLVPGDVLELALEATDNRRPPPPGVGRSTVLRLQVPSTLELLAAREEAAGEHRAGLESMRRQASDLGSQLERLRRELLKNPLPDWDRRQELQAALERQSALQEEMRRLAGALGRDLEQLADNQLTSPELLEKMDSIAELLAEHENQPLQSLLESLRESLQEMSPKELNRAMEDLAGEQQELLRRLDTAMNMLSDLEREQEMEGLTDMVAEMLAKQQDLAEETREEAARAGEQGEEDERREGADDGERSGSEQEDGEQGESSAAESPDGEQTEGQQQGEQGEGDPSDQEQNDQQQGDQQQGDQRQGDQQQGDQPSPEDMARRQEALAQEMEALEQRLEELQEQLEQEAAEGDPSAAEQEMREALEQLLEQLEQQQTSQTMQQAQQSLQQEQGDQASQQMDQALTDLASLYHVMLKTQAAMQMAMKQEQAGQMRDVAADLLALSDRQEHVSLTLPASLREVRADDLARRQHEVVRGTITVRDALEEVAGAAPQEVLRMLKQLDELIEDQGAVLTQMQEGRAQSARRAATTSLAGMNQLVINLLTQAQMTGQGGGSGQPQPMLSQQLRQMAENQSGLNTLAEQLARKQGRISQETRAGMQRLQQGQQGLAGQARQLAEEERARAQRGESGRLLGDLDRLAEAMEQVGDDAADGLISEETLRRQDRILSRLLDMHNASRERDWARRRESRSSDQLFFEQTGEASPDVADRTPEGRRWRPVEEAPPAYRDLVRRYFRQIQRLHEETGRLDDGQAVDQPGGGS